MGRELKRVPLDFDWELNKVWHGYKNHHYDKSHQCEECDGTGYSEQAELLKNLWYGYIPFKPEDRGSVPFLPTDAPVLQFAERNVRNSPDFYDNYNWNYEGTSVEREAQRLCDLFNSQWCHHLNQEDVDALIKSSRLHDLTHTFTPGVGWVENEDKIVPTPKQVNEWSIGGGIGHDSINQWVCVTAACERLGVPYLCAACEGDGTLWDNKEDELAAENWTRTEPPEGDGYQIWQTVSEGSPISPVFASEEELAVYMTTTRWGADKGTSYETWLKFIRGPGWAPSAISFNDVAVTGVEGVVMLSGDNTE